MHWRLTSKQVAQRRECPKNFECFSLTQKENWHCYTHIFILAYLFHILSKKFAEEPEKFGDKSKGDGDNEEGDDNSGVGCIWFLYKKNELKICSLTSVTSVNPVGPPCNPIHPQASQYGCHQNHLVKISGQDVRNLVPQYLSEKGRLISARGRLAVRLDVVWGGAWAQLTWGGSREENGAQLLLRSTLVALRLSCNAPG